MSDSGSTAFEVHVRFLADEPVVAVHGEVDMLTASSLEGVLNGLVAAGHDRLSMDLSDCAFLGASGIGVIAVIAAGLRLVGGRLAVRGESASVRELLELARVGDVVAFESASPEAPASAEVSELTVSPRAARLLRSSTDVVDAALRLVTALAAATVTNADGVSVTLERYGRLTTVAASNDAVLTMDGHQYDTGEGPCLAAKAEARWFYIRSLAEETRWPSFVPLALAQGIHSILSSPLMTNDRAQGALNIYSSTEGAFAQRDQALAELFAAQASEILTTAGADGTDESADDRFAAALETRRVIHRAQGVLIATSHVATEDVAAALHRAARARGVSVLQYAIDLIAAQGRSGPE